MTNILLYDRPACLPANHSGDNLPVFDKKLDLSSMPVNPLKASRNLSSGSDILPHELLKNGEFYTTADSKHCIAFLLQKRVPAQNIHILSLANRSIPDCIRADRANWELFRNIHADKRAFILGNGPSLEIRDLNYLTNEITFASNKIYLAFEQTEWRPTYYNVADELVAFYNAETIHTVESCRIIMETVKKHLPLDAKVIWLRELMDNTALKKAADPCTFPTDKLFFSTDCADGIQAGWTIIYNQLQLAFHMGIREIFLIGVDFSFNVPASIVDSKIYGKAVESRGEVNHFHKDYRKPGEKWAIPNMDYQHKMFEKARDAFQAQGGTIYNASRSTKLDVFPRVNFDTLFSNTPKTQEMEQICQP